MSAPYGNVIRVLCFVICVCLIASVASGKLIKEEEIPKYRQKVVEMFHHAYDGYIKYAYPYDELRPLTCDGHDTWGSYSLTLIDALDMLVIMGNNTEFQRVAHLVTSKMDFNTDINVSVFETNIRVVGGLLSAHLMYKRAGMDLEPGWPCSGPMLRMAEDVARRLLPAFDTPTGMPYGTVNLKTGVPKGETTVTCTAGVGTMIVEFGALSKLTGDPIFEKVAVRALESLWKARSTIDLVGNHIDVATGKWTALDAGVGGGVDSYFEYLVKGSIMFENPQLLQMYREFMVAVEKYLKRDDWYMWAHMTKGSISLPIFTSLDCYLPGIQSLLGDIDSGMKTMHNFHQVWKQFGFLPEFYNIVKNEAHLGREGYPLRPELVESAMYLYQATKDPYLLEIGADMIESIEQVTRTKCGYATVKNVNSHMLENRMESFFLAETTKYLYLLFDPDNFIHNTGDHGTIVNTPNGQCVIDTGSYVFNTEAHPIDTAALHCCSVEKKEDDIVLQNFHDNLDLLSLFDITESKDTVQGVKWTKARKQGEVHIQFRDGKGTDGKESLFRGSKQIIRTDVKGDNQKILSTHGQVFTTVTTENNAVGQNEENGDNVHETEIATDEQESCDTDGECDEKDEDKNKYTSSEDSSEINDQVDSSASVEDNFTLSKNGDEIQDEDDDDFDAFDVDSRRDEKERETAEKGKSTVVYIKQPETPSQTFKTNVKINDVLDILKSLTSDILGNSGIKSTKTLREKLRYYNVYKDSKPEMMTCKAQPFHMRFSVLGEMFLND